MLKRQQSITTITILLFQLVQQLPLMIKIVHGLEVGDEVCVEGYVMDQYCIDLGYLLDNPGIQTLVNPGAHSVHCLVDVTACRESNYVILLEPGAVTSTSSPLNAPTMSPIVTPSDIPTKAPIASLTKTPTKAPTKPPVAKTFLDLFPTLSAVNQPAAAPAIAPTPSNGDGPSFLDLFNALPAIAPTPSSNIVDVSMNEVNVVDDSLYSPGYVVDDAGKELLIQLGRTVGLCSTCVNTGTLSSGFRAEVRGTISEVSENNGPHKLTVSSVQLSNDLASICQQQRRIPVSTKTISSSSTNLTQSPLSLRSNNSGTGFISRFQNFVDSLFDNLF